MEDLDLSKNITFLTIAHIIGIIIVCFIIYWLNKMNKCKCSENLSEKKYLFEWFIFMIIWLIIYVIIIINVNGIIPTPINIMNSIFVVINIVMFIRLFIYLRKLRETKCNCGTLKELNVIYYYLIIYFSIMAFTFFIIIIVSIFMGISAAKLSKSFKSSKSNKNKSIK